MQSFNLQSINLGLGARIAAIRTTRYVVFPQGVVRRARPGTPLAGPVPERALTRLRPCCRR
jgi:hypothetical protein